MYDLAMLLASGHGTAQNLPEAIDWLKRSASFGVPVAMHQLASFYVNGIGVKGDPVEADYWASLAVRFYPADNPDMAQLKTAIATIDATLSDTQKVDISRRVSTFTPKPITIVPMKPDTNPVQPPSQPSVATDAPPEVQSVK
jgi:hypothetical protein